MKKIKNVECTVNEFFEWYTAYDENEWHTPEAQALNCCIIDGTHSQHNENENLKFLFEHKNDKINIEVFENDFYAYDCIFVVNDKKINVEALYVPLDNYIEEDE